MSPLVKEYLAGVCIPLLPRELKLYVLVYSGHIVSYDSNKLSYWLFM